MRLRLIGPRGGEAVWSGFLQIGVDEVSNCKGQRDLTCVTDHASGAIVWMHAGRSAATSEAFFAELGERRQRDPRRLDRHVDRL